jgi:hypothetical protein
MRRALAVLIAFSSMCLAGCASRASGSAQGTVPWKIGFWWWSMASANTAELPGLDALYVQVGRADRQFSSTVSWQPFWKVGPTSRGGRIRAPSPACRARNGRTY